MFESPNEQTEMELIDFLLFFLPKKWLINQNNIPIVFSSTTPFHPKAYRCRGSSTTHLSMP
jgi:hypothetical protein